MEFYESKGLWDPHGTQPDPCTELANHGNRHLHWNAVGAKKPEVWFGGVVRTNRPVLMCYPPSPVSDEMVLSPSDLDSEFQSSTLLWS